MSKAMLIIDEMPRSCIECPFKYKSEEMPLGNYTYKAMFRCKYEPDDISEDDGDIVYLNDIMMESKPVWCPLKELPQKKANSYADSAYKIAAKTGYNSCIDEILGKDNE